MSTGSFEAHGWFYGTARVRDGAHTGDDCCVQRVRDLGVSWFRDRAGSCSSCGASYSYGAVWCHAMTGEHIHLGHECSDNVGLLADWSGVLRYQKGEAEKRKRERALAKSAALAAKKADDREVWLLGQPGLKEAFELTGESWEARTLADMRDKLTKYGSLSDKQVAFALSLAKKLTDETGDNTSKPAPTGRVEVTGEVTGIKEFDWGFGMTVTVGGLFDSRWKFWCAVPKNLYTHARRSVRGFNDGLKGREVTGKVTLTPGREIDFAMGKRPSLELVEVETTTE